MKTTKEVAAQYGISVSRVVQLAKVRGVKPAKRVGPAFLWSASQVDKLRPNPVGRLPKNTGDS